MGPLLAFLTIPKIQLGQDLSICQKKFAKSGPIEFTQWKKLYMFWGQKIRKNVFSI
jgi:hypothetical protein